MTSAVRTKKPRRGRRSAEEIVVGGLVVLGVISSVFLIFSESVQLLRLGLVAALWAAIVGAIAMTKYRRESAVDKVKARDLQKVYELQLEREISARREYELSVEARVRHEVRADAEELAGLRAELVALRANLQVLFDGQLPVDRIALRADSTRIGEIGASQGPTPLPAYATDNLHRPRFATPYDEPVTAETSIILEPIVPQSAAQSEPEPKPEPKPEPRPEPVTEILPVISDAAPEEAAPDEDEPSDIEPELPEPRRRRRAGTTIEGADGSHSQGMSVAQILANLKSESEADAGAHGR